MYLILKKDTKKKKIVESLKSQNILEKDSEINLKFNGS